jgi:hypothetical protein
MSRRSGSGVVSGSSFASTRGDRGKRMESGVVWGALLLSISAYMVSAYLLFFWYSYLKTKIQKGPFSSKILCKAQGPRHRL